MTTTGSTSSDPQDPSATPGPSEQSVPTPQPPAAWAPPTQPTWTDSTRPTWTDSTQSAWAAAAQPGPAPAGRPAQQGPVGPAGPDQPPKPAGWSGPTAFPAPSTAAWATVPAAAVRPAGRWTVRRRVTAGVAAAAVLLATVGISASLGYASARTALGAGGQVTAPAVPGADNGSSGTSGGTTGGEGTGPGTGGWYGQGQGSGNGTGGSSRANGSTTVDSQPATAAESRGVALIDTVLPNGEAAGTGIVLTADGQVLTNYHVVEGSTLIRVTLADTGETYSATVVGADPSRDVALLQLADASGLTTATVDDDTVALGDTVTAVGNAGGTGTLTAADGTVTDLSAPVTTASEGAAVGEHLTGLLETSADVVPGDSGGPLIDAEGEVVGINTAASSGQVIDGYAIPISGALAVVQQIRAGQETAEVRIGPSPFLGIELSTGPSGSRSSGAGAGVAGVTEEGAAAQAGLAAGDTITRIGDTTIGSAAELSTALAGHQPDDRVSVTWRTATGQTHTATVTLGSSPIN